MAPQVAQYPRATSLTAHSSRAVGVEVAAWAASLITAPVGETFFAQHEAYLALCETKFALLTQKRRIWGVLRALGEFCHACAANQLSRAGLISPERCTAAAQQGSRRVPEGPAMVPVGGGGARPDFETMRRATHQQPGAAGEEGTGGTGGHRRASRSTTPSRQARVWRSRGRPGPTAPRTPAAPQAPPNGEASELLVVLRVLVGLAAVGAAQHADCRHLLVRQ